MKAILYVVLQNGSHVLASSKEANEEYYIDPKIIELECDHLEDWGCPLGGEEPCDDQGNSVVPIEAPTRGEVFYYL